MGVAILVVDYASQLTFLQAALVLGETEGLSPWTQYNPTGYSSPSRTCIALLRTEPVSHQRAKRLEMSRS